MSNAVVYKIVTEHEVLNLTAENVIPALSVRGFEMTGTHSSDYTREELQGQPTFDNLAGPMYDGRDRATGLPVIRYESWEMNERLSQ